MNTNPRPSWLDRSLSSFADVRAGEGATALLMLVNIFLLLVCYSIIKTVREPLILLGGGAEVRSYAAAGQALLLMGFVPAYGWAASRVSRLPLILGTTAFFLVCIELFAAAVAVRVPYVGVAFFVWVGIFNMSLVAQFWSFATDVYTKDAGSRLFPIIVIGMTAGAPLGSMLAARLFRLGLTPQTILQLSALLLSASALLYGLISRREDRRTPGAPQDALQSKGGFALVLGNPYLRLVALLVVILNVVNTTGEYLIARLLSEQVHAMALLDPLFDKQAYIGAFSGEYQFWVGVTALVLQACVTSRLVRHRGLAGVLFALPLIALGGYAIVAAGVGFSVVRWIKTAENAADYSIMNTARQMLWLPTSREEKYKAKQAIDTFFVRGGDVLSAATVYAGTHVLNLGVAQFALANMALTVVWLGVVVLILRPRQTMPRLTAPRRWVTAAALLTLVCVAAPARAQEDTRQSQWAARQAAKAADLRPYEPEPLERHIERFETAILSQRPVYLFLGSAFDGSGMAAGPGYRAKYGDSGAVDAHAAWSIKNYKAVDATLGLPELAHGRMRLSVRGQWLDAPGVAFYGLGADTTTVDKSAFQYRTASVGAAARLQASRVLAVGGTFDLESAEAQHENGGATGPVNPTLLESGAFVEVDTRHSPGYTSSGGRYRIGLTDYRQTGAGPYAFRRLDADVQRFVPILRDNWVIALRGLVSSTTTAAGRDVPFFLLPDLGGHTLRGYPAWRFRDRNRVLFTGEYRWTAGPFVDMAVFMDAGTVAARVEDLDLGRLTTTHGVGMFFHTPSATVTRIEVARSREGIGLVFSFSPSF